jgi:hypothetical protein
MRQVTFSGSFCFCDAGIKKLATAFSLVKLVTLPSQVKPSHIRVVVDCWCLLTGGGDNGLELLGERFTLLALFGVILRPVVGEKWSLERWLRDKVLPHAVPRVLECA